MKFKPPPKRRKVDADSPCSLSSGVPALSQLEKRDVVMTIINKSTALDTLTSSVNMRIQQARNYAVAQAKQDSCTGNFRVFDSPFGNYLVPAIPTREELGE